LLRFSFGPASVLSRIRSASVPVWYRFRTVGVTLIFRFCPAHFPLVSHFSEFFSESFILLILFGLPGFPKYFPAISRFFPGYLPVAGGFFSFLTTETQRAQRKDF
jgi:hypothetical protein